MEHDHDSRMRFVEVFRSQATNVSAACRAYSIDRKTFYNWFEQDKDFKEAIAEAREAMKDMAESQLYQLIKGIAETDKESGRLVKWKQRPDTAAIIFFLKTRCKDRGYIERFDLHRTDEPSIDMDKLSPAERQQLYALIEKAENEDETEPPATLAP